MNPLDREAVAVFVTMAFWLGIAVVVVGSIAISAILTVI